jgi:ABC-type glutathione transport system ATPase component
LLICYTHQKKKDVKSHYYLDQEIQHHKEVPLFDFSPELKNIKPEVNFKPIKKYEVPLEKLPKELEGKVKKQFILEYESECSKLLKSVIEQFRLALLKRGSMYMSNKGKQSPQLDLFTPVYEVFHELCLLLLEVGKEVFKWSYKKAFNKLPELEKIDRKALSVKKTTEVEDALGIDTKSRKEFLLNEIDFRRHSFIVGASGFGKTNLMSILQEHTLRKNKPIIFFDPKGDMEALNTFKGICEKYERPCYIFSEHYEDSISLNPVLEGTVNQVVDRIMRSFEWSEPYYRDASRRSLTQALKIIRDGRTSIYSSSNFR